jgi:hypothetical protein
VGAGLVRGELDPERVVGEHAHDVCHVVRTGAAKAEGASIMGHVHGHLAEVPDLRGQDDAL